MASMVREPHHERNSTIVNASYLVTRALNSGFFGFNGCRLNCAMVSMPGMRSIAPDYLRHTPMSDYGPR
jgi:hypothetical protein